MCASVLLLPCFRVVLGFIMAVEAGCFVAGPSWSPAPGGLSVGLIVCSWFVAASVSEVVLVGVFPLLQGICWVSGWFMGTEWVLVSITQSNSSNSRCQVPNAAAAASSTCKGVKIQRASGCGSSWGWGGESGLPWVLCMH